MVIFPSGLSVRNKTYSTSEGKGFYRVSILRIIEIIRIIAEKFLDVIFITVKSCVTHVIHEHTIQNSTRVPSWNTH